MTDQQAPTYEELQRRLASAEGALQALRGTQADTTAAEDDTLRDLNRAQALAQLGSWRLDLGAGMMSASAETRRIYGVADDADLPIERVQAIPLRQYRAGLDAALAKLIQEGLPYDVEFQIMRPSDGAIRHIHSVAEYDADRKSVVGTIQDVTERKQLEEKIRAREHYLHTILQTMADGFWVVECNQAIIEVNEAYCAMSGYARSEILSLRIGDIDAADHPEETLAHIQCTIANGSERFEVHHRRKDGSIFPVEVSTTWLDLDGGRIICFFRDLTERKRAEAERARLEAELQQAQKMESVGRLAGGVAHDFNNMLGVILGHAEMALEQVDPAYSLHVDLEEIQKAAQRSADLTRQLLAFARKQTISPKLLDLNETVANMLKMLHRLIGENIELIWKPGSRLWPVTMDTSQVDQILANLAVNARDAIAGVGSLAIETKNVTLDEAWCAAHAGLCPGDYVLLTISDSGVGMDQETLDHLFEPFFTTKDVGKGTGMGLATVYGAIQQNHGFITVDSELGRGTTFKIYLPRTENPLGTPEVPTGKKTVLGTETILLVEDEEAILNLGQAILTRHGYLVLAAHTPEAALALARRHTGPIHLLITDVVMPEMNGNLLQAQLTALRPEMKVLFISGYTADVIAHHGIIQAGVEFLQKPFSATTLTQKVREILD